MTHDLDLAALAVTSACVIVWGLVSARLERWDVSAPIAFVVLGLVVTHGPTTIVHFNLHSSTIRSLAEVTLALVLFADASRVNVRALRSDVDLPARLLGIGLPLTIGAGAVTAALLFGSSGLWVAAAIGAIVAPTDAALGASIMQDERVPSGVRRLLNVESGLNDGIATPFVNLFIAGAITTEAISGTHLSKAVVELVGGAGLGVAIGVVGAVLLALARRHDWSAPGVRPIAILALALFAYSTSVVAGTNGFITAFVAGMAFGTIDHHNDEEALEFTEQTGTLLSLLVWFIFGGVMLVPGMEDLGGAMPPSPFWHSPCFVWCRSPLLSAAPASTARPWPSWAGSDHAGSPPWSSALSPSIPWLQPMRRSCSPQSRSRLHSVCSSMASRPRLSQPAMADTPPVSARGVRSTRQPCRFPLVPCVAKTRREALDDGNVDTSV